MRVFITGGTGMIGRRLARRLKERGDQPGGLSRNSHQARPKPAVPAAGGLLGGGPGAAAKAAEGLGVRLSTIRTGVVLGPDEGALKVMVPIFKWLPGGAAPVGNGGHPYHPGRGRQWISWIHIEDIVGLFLLAIDNPAARGPINGTAPNPVRNNDFSRELARVLHRPFLPFGPPDSVLRVALGEKAHVV